MSKLKSYIKLVRPYQWVKNLFIFLPVFFSFRIMELPLLIQCLWAFLGFSMVASTIYIINDWCDIEADKAHPEKKNRPLASGAVTKGEASVLILLLLIIGFAIYGFLLKNVYATSLLGGYFVLNLLYSFKLKQIPIIDITIVAIGFVIRVFVGGYITGISITHWLIIMIFLLALFLALGKRRDDTLLYNKTGKKARATQDGYNLEFLNAAIVIVSGVIIVAYIMYTISVEVIQRNGDNLYLTSIFVILGLLRYLQIIFVEKRSGDPTKIFLKDTFLHFVFLGWITTFLIFSLIYK